MTNPGDRERVLNNFYTSDCNEDERLLSRHGNVEFLTTTKYLDELLKKEDKILEVGCATGRYALHYADLGYDVTGIDFVQANIDVLKSKIKPGMKIRAEQGDAIDLTRFDDNTFDKTLVLGPLYHLYTEEDIDKAIKEAIRVTKPNGYLALAYLTHDSIMVDWALKDHHLIDGYPKDFDDDFKMTATPEGVFRAFYVDEFNDIMKRYPVEEYKTIATDGMAHHMKKELGDLTDEEFEVWMNYHLKTCERKDLIGWSNHVLYIGRKK